MVEQPRDQASPKASAAISVTLGDPSEGRRRAWRRHAGTGARPYGGRRAFRLVRYRRRLAGPPSGAVLMAEPALAHPPDAPPKPPGAPPGGLTPRTPAAPPAPLYRR